MPTDPKDRKEIARAIADGEPIDWEKLDRTNPISEKTATIFRTLDLMRRIQQGGESSNEPASEIDESLQETGFEILNELGRGAHSQVYLAKDKGLDREVALKILKSDVPLGMLERKRFLKEARALASMDHPNIVRVHSIVQQDGRLQLCLERIQGRTLMQVMEEEGHFSCEEAVRIGIEVCRALAKLHERGLVHRDIKPTNVMVTEEGRVVLLDFGLAHSMGPADFSIARGTSGTPLVMAPEQFIPGSSLDHSVDIYALGVVLYWMVSGAFPFESRDFYDLKEKVIKGESIPLKDRGPYIAHDYCQTIEKAIAPASGERHPSARAFHDALIRLSQGFDNDDLERNEPLRTQKYRGNPNKGSKKNKKLNILTSCISLILLSAVIIVVWLYVSRFKLVTPTLANTLGNRIVFSAQHEGEWDIYSMNPTSGECVCLTQDFSGQAFSPKVSPDGTKISFGVKMTGKRQIYIMQPDGSGITQVIASQMGYFPLCYDWLDNQSFMYHSSPKSGVSEIRLCHIDGRPSDTFLDHVSEEDPYPDWFGISRNGKDLAVCAQAGSNAESLDIYLGSVNQAHQVEGIRPFFVAHGVDSHPVWGLDGEMLYWCHRTEMGPNGWENEIVAKSISSTETDSFDAVLLQFGEFERELKSISPDNASLLYSELDRLLILNIRTGEVSDLGLRKYFDDGDSIKGADWADLRMEKILFSATHEGGATNIFTINPQSSEPDVLLERKGCLQVLLKVAPDGKRVAIASQTEDGSRLDILNFKDSSLESIWEHDKFPTWNKLDWLTNYSIVYSFKDGNNIDTIWQKDLKESPRKLYHHPGLLDYTISPGNPLIVLSLESKDEEGSADLHIYDMRTGQKEPFFTETSFGVINSNPVFHPNGSEVAWTRTINITETLKHYQLVKKSLTSIRNISEIDGEVRKTSSSPVKIYAYNPEGNFLLISRYLQNDYEELLHIDLTTGDEAMVGKPVKAIQSADWRVISADS